MSIDLIKDQLGQSMPEPVFQEWLTTMLNTLVLTTPEPRSESLLTSSVSLNPCIETALVYLNKQEYEWNPPKTPEEKLAKKIIKKYVKQKEQEAKKAEYEAKKAAMLEAHPEWADFNPQVPYHGCFGYLNGHLILGTRHHQAIMAMLLDKGWTWEDLFNAKQVWGWYTIYAPSFDSPWFNVEDMEEPSVSVSFVSDAAIMHAEAADGCIEEFKKVLGVNKVVGGEFMKNRDVKRHGLDYGGDFDRHYTNEKGELVLPSGGTVVYEEVTPIPEPPSLQEAMVP